MASRKRSSRERRPVATDAPIVVMPGQTLNEIASRQRIRESIHDAKAITVKSQPSTLTSHRGPKNKP